MRCEEVRELLPAYVDRDLRPVGELEMHLASCGACGAELASYRELLADLGRLRDRGEEPSPDLLARTLSLVPPPSIAARVIGSVQDHRLLYALASLGGAAVGAAAIALVWWRVRRAAVQQVG